MGELSTTARRPPAIAACCLEAERLEARLEASFARRWRPVKLKGDGSLGSYATSPDSDRRACIAGPPPPLPPPPGELPSAPSPPPDSDTRIDAADADDWPRDDDCLFWGVSPVEGGPRAVEGAEVEVLEHLKPRGGQRAFSGGLPIGHSRAVAIGPGRAAKVPKARATAVGLDR